MSIPKSILNSSERIKRSIILVLICLLAPSFAEAQSRGVRAQFRKAQIHIQKKRYNKAAKILKKMIRRYPDYKASYYLLGRLHYRNGNMRKAARFFRKAGLSFARGNGAFEYGISMFSTRQYSAAIKALKRVPRKSPARHVANFYIGSSYLQFRQWSQAERYLRAARKLPQGLARTKNYFLRQILRKKREEARGRFTRPIPYTFRPPPMQPQQPVRTDPYAQPPSLPGGPGSPGELKAPGAPEKEEKTKPKPPPKPKRGLVWTFTPSASYLNETTNQNRHATGEKQSVRSGPKISLDVEPRYLFKPEKSGKQMALFGMGTLTVQDYKTQSDDVTFLVDEEGELSSQENSENSQDKNYKLELEGGVEFPFSRSTDLVAAVGGSMKYPDFKADEQSSTQHGRVGVDLDFDSFILGLSGKLLNASKVGDPEEGEVLTTTVNEAVVDLGAPLPSDFSLSSSLRYVTDAEPEEYAYLRGFASTMTLDLGVRKSWDSFSAGVTATQFQNSPPSGVVVSGTASELKILVKLGMTFDFGLSLRLEPEYAQISEYTRKGLTASEEAASLAEGDEEETFDATATGQRTGFTTGAKFAPIDWAFLDVSYSFKETKYSVAQPELLQDFQSKVADQVWSLKVLIGLSTSF